MEKIGIFYGSSSGNTESVANQIAAALGEVEIFNVDGANKSDLEDCKNIILGASTWGVGDLQDDFDDFLSELGDADLAGKKVAIFGLGDQESYADSFVDGMGAIYEAIADKGCELVGKTSVDGYSFDESRAVVDGEFCGLVIDEDNQSDLTEERVNNWVEVLKSKFL